MPRAEFLSDVHPMSPPACVWRDSPQRYGRISRWLHWAMALLLGWQFLGMALKLTLGREAPLAAAVSGTHAHVGLLLLVFVMVRGAWALTQSGRRPLPNPGWLGRLAQWGHGTLYALMLVVPGLALLRMLGNNRAFSWWGVWTLNDGRGEKVAWMVAPGNAAHGVLGWLLLGLIAGHVLMALVHHWVWKDQVLQRMLGRVPPP